MKFGPRGSLSVVARCIWVRFRLPKKARLLTLGRLNSTLANAPEFQICLLLATFFRILTQPTGSLLRPHLPLPLGTPSCIGCLSRVGRGFAGPAPASTAKEGHRHRSNARRRKEQLQARTRPFSLSISINTIPDSSPLALNRACRNLPSFQ